jgi:hypothetical protein
MEGYYASARPDPFLIRKAMDPGQAIQEGNDYHLQLASIPVASENAYTNKGTGRPPGRSTLKTKW